MNNIDTDWLSTWIEQVRTAQLAHSRYFQTQVDQLFRRVDTAPDRIPGDDARRLPCEQSDGMMSGPDSNDWRLGFASALSGWTAIPPAGANRTSWLAGWQAGRTEGLQRERQSRHREASALSC